MLNTDPKERPSIDEVLNHPWFHDNQLKRRIKIMLASKKASAEYDVMQQSFGKVSLENNAPVKGPVGRVNGPPDKKRRIEVQA